MMILNIHEDKCVNERRILKTHYKKQTTVLSVMFVLVGMMFLIPAITEKAQASITAHARAAFPFLNVRGIMYPYSGFFTTYPGAVPGSGGREITWATSGLGGNEIGQVVANVGPAHTQVHLHFINPFIGPNHCFVQPANAGSCDITQGIHATARYLVIVGGTTILPDANGGDANSGDEGDNSDDTP
jgi:hypothetical protein